MPLQEGVATRVAYKVHTATSMTPNTELVPASDPGASSAQELRRVSSTLTLNKDTYQSAEIRSDRQVADMRHGTRRVQGEISGELSLKTYFPLLEAAFRATKAATFDKTESDLTSVAAANATSKFTAGGSTWAAQGFRVGDVISFASLSEAANNAKNFLIYALSTVDAFVYPAPTDMGADSAFTVTRLGTKITIPTSSHAKRLWAFEHYLEDSDEAHLFTECRVTGARLAMPATGLNTITLPITGRKRTILTGGSAPFFTSPSAAGTDGITAAVNGVVMYEGEKVGVLTGIDVNLEMSVDAPAVAGQNFVPEIFLGRSVVTGQATMLFEDSTLLTAFDDESIVELLVMLTTTSAANSPFMALAMTNVKFTGANLPLQGEGALPVTLPFQALLKPSTVGYDQSSLVLIDSAAT